MNSSWKFNLNHSNDPTNKNKSKPKASTENLSDTNVDNLLFSTIGTGSNLFAKQFTSREEELQRLLALERQRSEQRKTNYNILKEEHLKLQSEFLSLQSEMKQTLEETMYFKEKKNNELDELLQTIEEKSKNIAKLERVLRDNEPDMIRLKCLAEMEEPMKRLQKDNDRLTKEKEKAIYESQIVKQQLDHLEKEHLDSIERIKLSYEAEVNLIKREKEEIRTRLVEASQSPDVKRIVEMSEENSRLNRKLQSAQVAIEQAEGQYRQIQSQIEQFVVEQDQQNKLHENEIKQLQQQIHSHKNEIKGLRIQIENKKNENENFLDEIGRLKRLEEKLRFEVEQAKTRGNQEKENLRITMEKEKEQLFNEIHLMKEQFKKLRHELESKDLLIESTKKESEVKRKEVDERVKAARRADFDKVCFLEQKRKTLELCIKEFLNEKHLLKCEIGKIKKQYEQQNESKLEYEREIMILRTKLETQTATIEELEKIRRQHIALHEEVNRLRLETYDLIAINKELTRSEKNAKEEINKLKKDLHQERNYVDEIKLSNEKTISKLNRKIEEERQELYAKVSRLENENIKLKINIKPHKEVNDLNRLRTKQYTKVANHLTNLLEQLKIDESNRSDERYTKFYDGVQQISNSTETKPTNAN
ncbi:hypothetical protein RDWZM_003456 [Blomia tropicalis]|uniref:Uncharacterized protein n=1 Tax=Blomia tropicalis TaxID=40697 RepID=A0A9Q0MFF8_BLOTA|nr:establishment of centrosome localization [Blomia tropicalis]KAJ6224911.1 hypothetical protein RDWZM_003456 [Blomia tropicalis]